MYLYYVVFMFTNVYYYGSSITKLRCEGKRVLYGGFSMKITHEKNDYIPQHEIANVREISRYVELRKVDLTALRSVDKHT